MPGVSISDLTSDYLFEARILHKGNNQAQLDWLIEQYQAEAADRTGAEITATSFKGSSHSAQFRASTPDDRRSALRSACESIESVIAGDVANSLRRPFGFRFAPGCAPHETLNS